MPTTEPKELTMEEAWTERDRLRAEGDRLLEERERLLKERERLARERARLWAETESMWTEADQVVEAAASRRYGKDVQIDWMRRTVKPYEAKEEHNADN